MKKIVGILLGLVLVFSLSMTTHALSQPTRGYVDENQDGVCDHFEERVQRRDDCIEQKHHYQHRRGYKNQL